MTSTARFLFRLARLGLALAAFASFAALAAVPQKLNYQGVLTNAAGTPVNTGGMPLTMTFKLYNALSGGSALYTEVQQVNVTGGVFNVQLGSVTTLTLPFDVPYFLEITIGVEALSPRQPLASSAYALRSGCLPGDRVSCFTGSTGTPGVAGCLAGTRICNTQGTGFGACTGEVIPNCGATCANLLTDNNNCGACGNICPVGQSCGGGGSPGVCGAALACGDGIVSVGESCDDNNANNGDGCAATCQVESGFSCSGSPSVCVPTLACGDGIVSVGESCDDNNVTNGDGCSASCQVEMGFSCSGSPSACSAVCGDGIVVGTEQCDDAPPAENGDGCSATCQIESGFTCVGSPSVCTPGSPLGSICIANGDCFSGFCSDNRCSNTACNGLCMSTNVSGICTFFPFGATDNDLGCNGQLACNGAGACKKITGAPCMAGADCLSNVCTANVCN